MESTVEPDHARLGRRALIGKAAIAGAAAWTAPMVLDSLASPAGAVTCPTGTFIVVYENLLSERTALGLCANESGATSTTAAAVGLSATFSSGDNGEGGTPCSGSPSISHVASTAGNYCPVRLTISGCSCTITSVYGHVHRRGAPVGPPDCPSVACQQAVASTTTALRIVGTSTTTSVAVQPNYSSSVCSGASGVHWGRPYQAAGDTTSGNPNPGGTENGYLVVRITCT